MLDLNISPLEWVEIAPLNHGRYQLALVAAGNLLYAVGGDSPFSNRKDVEVINKCLQTVQVQLFLNISKVQD